MKKFINQFKILALFVAIIVFIAGCSKDDTVEEPVDQDGGNVFRYQMVIINVPNTTLNQNEYDGSLGNKPVTLSKTEDHKLVFAIPVDARLGNSTLVVPGLNNMKIKYNVLQPELEQSAQQTLNSYFSLVDNTFSNIEGLNTSTSVGVNNFNKIKTYLETADEETKLGAALFYQVNKSYIENLFAGIYPESRLTDAERQSFIRFGKSVVAMGAGVWVAYAGYTLVKVNPGSGFLALGAALVGTTMVVVGFEKAKEYGLQIVEGDFFGYNTSINEFIGQNNREIQDNNLIFYDNTETILPFKVGTRQLTENENNSTKSLLVNFFSSKSTLNSFIEKINEALAWFNEELSLSTEPIELYSLVTNPATSIKNVTPEIMEDFAFSISHPNLQLLNASLQSNGQLNLKIKIIGNPETLPVVATLNYSYDDEVCNYSGSFPIEVSINTDNFLVGTWTLTEYNGYTANQYHALSVCSPEGEGTMAGFTVYGTATFTQNTFNCPVGRNQVGLNCVNNVPISGLNYDIPNYYPHSGSYESNGNYQFTITSNTPASTNATINVVNQNTIIINYNAETKKYIRN